MPGSNRLLHSTRQLGWVPYPVPSAILTIFCRRRWKAELKMVRERWRRGREEAVGGGEGGGRLGDGKSEANEFCPSELRENEFSIWKVCCCRSFRLEVVEKPGLGRFFHLRPHTPPPNTPKPTPFTRLFSWSVATTASTSTPAQRRYPLCPRVVE